ncbi:MAG: hypothetical protein HY226_03100 [Candidatus Vogelbacteria bacterium]|nr:hypothetical protein [Candidatus Vogelbacteria bacterium]
MKLFLIGWNGKEIGMIEIAKKLKKNHQILYWTACDIGVDVDPADFPGTVFHDHDDAYMGIPPKNFDLSEIEPVGMDLIGQMYETESVVLTMMNKRFEGVGVLERKHIYYHYLSYWNYILKKFSPERIIFPALPHTVYNYVLFSLAKKLGIKTLIFEPTSIRDRTFITEDFTIGSDKLRDKISALKGKSYTVNNLSSDIKKYYLKQIDVGQNNSPEYVKRFFDMYRGYNLLRLKFGVICKQIAKPSFLVSSFRFIKRKFGRNSISDYVRLQWIPDFNKKYIYMPLHYQPEGTTSPLGDAFVDQILAVEVLSKSLPPGWLIYVKEHPAEWTPRALEYFSYRHKGYYEEMVKNKNVKLMPMDTDTYTLIRNSQAVASITGTACWEGLLRGKPAIVFGHAWYRDCGGVYKVSNFSDTKMAIKKIIDSPIVESQEVVNYLVALDATTFKGFRSGWYQDAADISVEENIVNHVHAIEEILVHGL